MIGVFYNHKPLLNTLVLVFNNDEIIRETKTVDYWIGFNAKDEVVGINIFNPSIKLPSGYLAYTKDINDLVVKLTGRDFSQYINKNNFVVANVVECNKIEGTHLSKCLVNNGKEQLQIICGAKNVRAGLKVVLAQIGAIMPNGLIIKQGKLQNLDSFGMLCSQKELNITGFNETGIIELYDQYVVGQPFNLIFKTH